MGYGGYDIFGKHLDSLTNEYIDNIPVCAEVLCWKYRAFRSCRIEKRAKEKKLRELDKLEKQLKEKESQINEKQQEFEKATQGHIYSADKEVIQEVVVEPETKSEQKSISERMRDIKYKYDNGEISYEEYKIQRQKLLEEE